MALRRYIDRFVYLALAVALFAMVFTVADTATFSSSTRVVAALGTSPVGSLAMPKHGPDHPLLLACASALFATVVLASVSRPAALTRASGSPIAVLSTPLRI